MKIAAGLPQAHQQAEDETSGIEGRSHVVAEKLRIPEDISYAGVVICVPKCQRNRRDQKWDYAERTGIWGTPKLSERTLLRQKTDDRPRSQRQGSKNRRLFCHGCEG